MFLRTLELKPRAKAKLEAAGLIHPDVDRAFMAARWHLLKVGDKGMLLAGSDPPMYLYKHNVQFHSVEYFLIRYTLDGNQIVVHDIKIEP